MSDAVPGPGVAAGPPPVGGLHAAAARQSNAVHTNGRATPPSYGNAGPADRGSEGRLLPLGVDDLHRDVDHPGAPLAVGLVLGGC